MQSIDLHENVFKTVEQMKDLKFINLKQFEAGSIEPAVSLETAQEMKNKKFAPPSKKGINQVWYTLKGNRVAIYAVGYLGELYYHLIEESGAEREGKEFNLKEAIYAPNESDIQKELNPTVENTKWKCDKISDFNYICSHLELPDLQYQAETRVEAWAKAWLKEQERLASQK